MTVCVLRSVLDYLRLAVSVVRSSQKTDPSTRYFKVKKRVRIAMKTSSSPLPVQADGEIIGETPVEVELLVSAIKVVVPQGREEREAEQGAKA